MCHACIHFFITAYDLARQRRNFPGIHVNLQTEKSFRNLIESNRNQIVFTIFRLIWIQADVRLDPN